MNLPAVKVFSVSLLLWLIAYEYCRFRFWREPHSAFFSEKHNHVYEWKYSLYREHESRRMIALNNAAQGAQTEVVKAGPHPLLCAAVITVRRDAEDYFDATVSSLLEGLDPRERRAIYLNIFFADVNTSSRHPSWGMRWLDRLADQVSTYDLPKDQLVHLQGLADHDNFYEKGIL